MKYVTTIFLFFLNLSLYGQDFFIEKNELKIDTFVIFGNCPIAHININNYVDINNNDTMRHSLACWHGQERPSFLYINNPDSLRNFINKYSLNNVLFSDNKDFLYCDSIKYNSNTKIDSIMQYYDYISINIYSNEYNQIFDYKIKFDSINNNYAIIINKEINIKYNEELKKYTYKGFSEYRDSFFIKKNNPVCIVIIENSTTNFLRQK